MIALALQARPYFKFSTIEIEHQGPSYSVNSIAELKAQAVEPTDWYFILGWDNLAKIPLWKEPAKLIEMCFLAAVPRPGYERPNMKKLEAALPGISKKVILMDKPRMDISATDIRNKVLRVYPSAAWCRKQWKNILKKTDCTGNRRVEIFRVSQSCLKLVSVSDDTRQKLYQVS